LIQVADRESVAEGDDVSASMPRAMAESREGASVAGEEKVGHERDGRRRFSRAP